jgi:hypothetical protein
MNPDYIVADSGSVDIGPQALGANTHVSPEEWQRHDLELMLLASRKLNVPMIVGSASDTGTNRGVMQFVRIINEIAEEHGMKNFKIATIFADIDLEFIRKKLEDGIRIEGLYGRPDLTFEDLERTENVVAVMGAEPIVKALDAGADVIIAGRSCDSAIFAAPLLKEGFGEAVAWYAGKVLECASFCAEPFMGKESIIGTIDGESIVVEPMHPVQRCTPLSILAHTIYERPEPFEEHVPGGYVDMRECRYEQIDDRRTRVTGMRFVKTPYKIKLEGAGKVGERAFGFAGIRDPYLIRNIDDVLEWSRSKVESKYGREGYRLFYHLYGKNAILKEMEPVKEDPHEIGILVEAVAETAEKALDIAHLATRWLFYARLPMVKGTAGTCAFPFEEALLGKPAYEFTIHHLMPSSEKEALELFPVKVEEV